MSTYIKSLAIMILATIIGLILVPIITVVGALFAEMVIKTFFPLPKPTQMFSGLVLGFRIVVGVYFSSTLIAGFSTGFLIQRWGVRVKAVSYRWQSFVGGFVIGILPPTLAHFIDLYDLIYVAALALPPALAGFGGHYVAEHRYKKQTTE